jgi:hypothetical protein
MTVINKAKENPLITAVIAAGGLAVAVTGIWQGISLADKLHTTQSELLLYDLKAHTFAVQQFAGVESKLGELEVVGKCRWLLSEIRALKDSIYVRKRDKADPDYINDLEGNLEELEDQYRALTCARKLS